MKLAALVFLCVMPLCQAGPPEYFVPEHRISGIGVARDDLSDDQLEVRKDLMIQSQTFAIMRDPQAVTGARRITTDAKLQSLFHSAAESSGLQQSTLEAIAYLESWGDANAQSSAGPRGIMQISAATARAMGLRVLQATRYRVMRERVAYKTKSGKIRYRTVSHRTPYVVTARDDRLYPDRAIPAAAKYIAGMEQKFGGLDWAIFAYHCGQGCVAEMQDLTRHARGIPKDQITVPRMFFSCSPAWNRELYQAIEQQMQRDWSPTYYFRVMRAEQLLALYRRAPDDFENLWNDYRAQFWDPSAQRAQQRLSVWLKHDDVVFHSCDDIRIDTGKRLAKAFDRPDYFGYRLKIVPDTPSDLEFFSEASPAAIGTLAYISFETRRLMEQMTKTEQFRPLDVVTLVEPEDFVRQQGTQALMHCSGQVFDIDYSGLPPAELEALRFVLDDLGWDGYLGFVEEGRDNLHIGCSPTSRDFFTSVFEEAGARESAMVSR
jgi:hypothetical protein